MKRFPIMILLGMLGLFLGMNGFAQGKEISGRGDTGNKGAESGRISAFMVTKIIGSRVINLEGETLGKVEDLVVDIDTGRILFALLDFGGFLGVGHRLSPVPWVSLAALPLEGMFFLDQTKEELEKAPSYNKNNLPDMGDMHWGSGIFKHYGYDQGLRGYDYGHYGSSYGPYPGSAREDPYGRIFDPKTIKTITGQVIKVERIAPAPTYGMEIRLIVYVDKREIIPVFVGPVWYVEGPSQEKGFKSGDKVTVTGSQVRVRGKSFMIAMEVKQGDETLRVRDKEGIPSWIGWRKAG